MEQKTVDKQDVDPSETMINKVTCKGFKSFSGQTAIPFYDGLTAIVGSNGSGKCVSGDTQILTSDGDTKQIRELVEGSLRGDQVEEIEDGVVSYDTDFQVPSLNPETLEVEHRNVLACAKRRSPNRVRKLTLESGTELEVTDDHPVFVLREGEVTPTDSENLCEGDSIAAPRRTPISNADRSLTGLLESIKGSDSLYVPYSEELESLARGLKEMEDATWEELAEDVGVDRNVFKGLVDGQSVRLSAAARILKHSGLDDSEVLSRIKQVEPKNYSKKAKLPTNNNPQLSKFLGYLLAEGRVDMENNQVWFTNSNEELVEEYTKLSEEVLGVSPDVKEYSPNCLDAIAFSAPATKIVEALGVSGDGSGSKHIPGFFLRSAGQTELQALLESYLAGDGYVSESDLSATTKSSRLAEELRAVLLRLGVKSTVNEKTKEATNSDHKSATYFEVRVSGRDVDELASQIQIPVERKQRSLDKLAAKNHNTNRDTIPLENPSESLKHIDAELTSKQTSRMSAYTRQVCEPSRQGLSEILQEAMLQDNKSESIQNLSRLASSDIYWEKIENIEDSETDDEWVYDLNVAVNHNFVAEGTFVHNSNIINALSFVFGRRSSKLRAERMEQLIFNGGQTGSPADEAKVTVRLDNSSGIFDDFLDEHTDEVKIARKVTQAGSSIYKLQGTTTKKREIDRLARRANIDPEGYHFVRQGQVTEIVEQSDTERRKVIDELSGVKKFDDEREAALEELEEVEEKLQEEEFKLQQKKERLDELEEQKELAIQYRELEQRKEKLEASILEVRKRALSNQLANINTDVSEKQDRIEELDADVEDIDDRIDELQERISDIEQERGGKSDVEHLETRIEKKRGELQNKRDRKQDLEETVEELERMKNNRSTGSKAVDAVLNLDTDGVYGVFQDTISFDSRYGVAMDTAAAGHMTDVVVQDGRDSDRGHKLPEARVHRPRPHAAPREDRRPREVSQKPDGAEEEGCDRLCHRTGGCRVREGGELRVLRHADSRRSRLREGCRRRQGRDPGRRQDEPWRSHDRGKSKSRSRSGSSSTDINIQGKRDEIEELEEDMDSLRKDIAELKEMKDSAEQEGAQDDLLDEKQEIRSELDDLRENRQEKYSELQRLKAKVEDTDSKKARLKSELEKVRNQLKEFDFDEDELTGLDSAPEDLESKKQRVVTKQNSMGRVNMMAIEEFKELKEEYDDEKQTVSEIRREKLKVEEMLEEVEKRRRKTFMSTLEEVNRSFSEFFTDLFGGGNAELVLEDDDIEKGLKIRAAPPDKDPHILKALSGGEKTMTAVAFVFAVLEYEESPFYIMDEIDAALDKENSRKLGELLRDHAGDTQFIVISHEEITVRHADRAYGVSMTNGVSELRSIELQDA
jgi:Chromosome segregation ATPases